jgi:hypothetical protein
VGIERDKLPDLKVACRVSAGIRHRFALEKVTRTFVSIWSAEKPAGIAQVLEQGFKEGKSTMIADGLFGLFEAAEFEEGVAAGLFGVHAGAQVVCDVQFEVASSSCRSRSSRSLWKRFRRRRNVERMFKGGPPE